MKSLKFHQKGNVYRIRAKQSMVVEKISIKQQPSTLKIEKYRTIEKKTYQATVSVHPLHAQERKTINLSCEKVVPDKSEQVGPAQERWFRDLVPWNLFTMFSHSGFQRPLKP